MKGALAVAVAVIAASPLPAWAQGEDDEEEAAEDEGGGEEEEEAEPKKASAEDEGEEDEEESDDDGLPIKQNLTGHDEGTDKKANEFEKDRFFVDKVDTEATENATLIQGSLSSSSFFYGETGGNYPVMTAGENTGPRRLFTELRLQTDFRHIKASRWDARIDVRGRFVPQPADDVSMGAVIDTPPNRIQAGLLGENELDVREMWLIRSGKRSDVFIGRQFVPDLGGVKFDGLRIDYAKSAKVTLIGFGGLMPVRGSRSVTTDYAQLQNEQGKSAGRFVATGGFGGAYRTVNSYGALGAVVQAPLKEETPRLFVTTNGYLRNGAKLDVFHYILVDVLGTAASESTSRIQLTNLSGGLNFKPNPRLRLTGAFHRVDTETLAVHAGAYLNDPDVTGAGGTVVQSDTYVARIATNTARAGVSAGLGKQQRFEVSTAISYRFRPEFALRSPDPNTPTIVELPGASSVEVWGSFVDRRSIKGTRIGIEASRAFKVGTQAYQRSILLTGRLFVLREIAGGRGEWEAEASFSNVADSILAMGNIGCANPLQPVDCFGTSSNNLYQIGGQVFYRLKRDWFGIATLHLLRMTNVRSDKLEDPAVMGVTGFVRIAKRF